MTAKQLFTETLNWFCLLLHDLKNKRNLLYIVVSAVSASVIAGFVLYLIDANIHSPLDGIWSAWVTMTHVGFGDVVPSSFLGRLVSALLILLGLTLFSLFTAILSAALINKNVAAWDSNVQQIQQDTTRIESREDLILMELQKLQHRIDSLEQQLITTRSKKK
jgi:voltage-gated potassium channel